MAFLRRRGVAEAFRNNRHLQQFMLTAVTPTGKVLGTGSFGSVEEVKYQHLVCAGKKLHEALIEAGNEGLADVVRKYEQECQLMSSLRHPNITQFLGLCFLPGTQLPLLVMERLETSLDDLLEHMPGLPLSLKRSVLEDVASGLVYLHKRTPPVIHRDLTSKNVLLTSSLVAKITDMGNSRIFSTRPGQMARTLSQLPGTLVYMPPEALDETHRYGPSLDIFSFGHLALYTITQKFPGSLLSSTYYNPDNPREIRARTEVERRGEYIAILETQIGWLHPDLVDLIKQCLHNVPEERPVIEEVLERLQRMRVEVEGGYGSSLVKLDIHKVLLLKEMKMKERRIEELTQHQEETGRDVELKERDIQQLQAEIVTKDDQIQELQTEVGARDRQLRQMQRETEAKDEQLHQLQRETEAKDERLQQLQREIGARDEQLQQLQREKEESEHRFQDVLQSKEAEISRLTEALRANQGLQLEGAKKEPPTLKLPLQLRWRRGPDMPLGMGGHVQSVMVQQKVYIGGGDTSVFVSENSYIVMEYDTLSGKWSTLPPYRACDFGMAKINNQLVLVGGLEQYSSIKLLGAWRAESKEWTHPYPEMPTARSQCSAVTCNKWLVVAGGKSKQANSLSSVEIMDTINKQWYTGPSTPISWYSMKTATVGDTCFFMGGSTRIGVSTNKVYSVSFSALTFQLLDPKSATKRKGQIWKVVSGLQVVESTPLSINGSLFALGGWKDHEAVTEIHLYQPETGEWVKVGELPSQHDQCTSVMISDREILVAGGWKNAYGQKRTDIAVLE